MEGFASSEQETVIIISRNEEMADIYSNDGTMLTKLNKIAEASDEWEITEETKNSAGRIIARRFSCPKNLISFRKKTKVMTDEQIQKAVERFAKARQ